MRILLVLGVFIEERLYRELPLVNELIKRDLDVTIGVPSKAISLTGYSDDIITSEEMRPFKCIYLDTPSEFREQIDRFDAIVAGTWKQYTPFIEYARARRKFTLVYNSTTGLDHWTAGAEYTCVKSRFARKMLESWMSRGFIRDDCEHMYITGAVAHAQGSQDLSELSEEEFRTYYRFADAPIALIFPKGLVAMERKVRKWFPGWPKRKHKEYVEWMKNSYFQICTITQKAGYHVLIKLHPSTYAEFFGSGDRELDFWDSISAVRILEPRHCYDAYRYARVGISINSHSAVDMGYHKKPFIYVDSDQIEIPDAYTFHVHEFCSLPLGPSLGRSSLNSPEKVNPWFPSWVGYFSRMNELEDLLTDIDLVDVPSDHYQRFIEEFWYSDDGKPAERVAEVVSRELAVWEPKVARLGPKSVLRAIRRRVHRVRKLL